MTGQRSKPYPNINIVEAVSRIEALKHKSGMAKQYDPQSFALGIGYKDDKSGAFTRTTAALSQYNLIQKEGSTYVLTDTARKILIPSEDGEREGGMREATLNPPLFASLYADWRGQELPALFSNILVNKYGILDGAKNKAAGIFKSSLEAVGLLDGNRVIDPAAATVTALPSADTEGITGDNQLESDPKVDDIPEVPSTTLTKDFGQGRVVKVTLPNDISEDERKKLVILIENM